VVTPWRRNRLSDGEPAAAGHARELIRVTIEEIGRADAKAGVLFTGAGVVLGVAASILVADPGRFSGLPLRLKLPLLIAVACGIVAVTALGVAAYPRGVRGCVPSGGRVTYFGDVVRTADDAQLQKALGSAPDSALADLARQLRRLSLITCRKYFYIRVAYLFFAVNLLAILTAVIEVLCAR
jgi:Family of unknown function (DUF5706)